MLNLCLTVYNVQVDGGLKLCDSISYKAHPFSFVCGLVLISLQ